ncbi:MAG: hypothetical protein H6Q14_1335 [Bacteroidetes bacterium]|nr:hypothetical protein [Bacteroidota bacterium]
MGVSKKDVFIKIALEVSRLLLGTTFLFSGFVKAVDPLGTAYKIQDYLTAIGMTSLHSIALPVSIGLCVMEFLLGAWLLLGLYRRVVTKLLFLVMLSMAPLTLYLAIKNPVHDCGCFGDFLILTNWETFYKNLVLLPCALTTLVWHNRISPLFSRHTYWLAALSSAGFILSFTVYNFMFLPVFDFRPYKTGTDLRKLVAEKSKGDVYQNTFVYEKDGKRQGFTEENYPWKDPSWKFVEMKSVLVKEGKKSEVEDFAINHLKISSNRKRIEDETDITESVLNDTSYTFLMTAYSLKDMSESHLSDFEDISYYAQEHGYKFYCLTASNRKKILDLIEDLGVNYDFCLTDERVLKTMVRSNPGLVLLKNGKIIHMWPDSRVPQEKELNKPLDKLSFTKPIDTNQVDKDKFLILCIIFVSPLLTLQMIDLIVYKRPKRRKEVGDAREGSKEEEL